MIQIDKGSTIQAHQVEQYHDTNTVEKRHETQPVVQRRYNPDADEARWSRMMARAHKGDGRTYQALLTELSQVLASYLRKYFSSQDVIDDCIQDVLLALHHARDTYDPDRPFRPWFFSIARYKCVDTIRKIKKQSCNHSLDEVVEAEGAVLADQTHRPLDDALTLKALLSELTPEYREAVVMTKVEGLSIAEAADRTDTSVSTMKVRVHRAVHKLKSLWGRGYE